ncbi:acyltransferase [Legionella nagasakiensis]|uniref:acyltransferase n=1 Tax=Legionella nagasakiensis TaxID=535290 RepID=UPI0010555D47|nr:acyltransferase [Legionella nagasakiensis]
MYIMIRLIFCFVFILLASCTKQTPASGQAGCRISCEKQFNECKAVCTNNCRRCSTCTDLSAAKSYNQYKHEQCMQGGIIARELKSYRDPLQCRKTTCNCLADYRMCVQSCAGTIQKRLQVAPTCC